MGTVKPRKIEFALYPPIMVQQGHLIREVRRIEFDVSLTGRLRMLAESPQGRVEWMEYEGVADLEPYVEFARQHVANVDVNRKEQGWGR